jgi:hypothetical protein
MDINTILFIISLLVIIIIGTKNSSTEKFVQDISGTGKNQIIYDTVPYGSSGLFYDYVVGSPYWYNPLDYWLNPYYYNWGPLYGSYRSYGPSYVSSTSIPYVTKRHIRRTRHIRR